jgi:FADH2 O2-dependent halogenase
MNDVIIIGGGPAGSAAGCLLAKAGLKPLILEGFNHPRQHVGESMVTSSTRVFKELDFLKVLERERFVHKYGASWHSFSGEEAAIWFKEFPQEGVDQDYTYHVDRSKLDLLMLKHAEDAGAEVYQGVKVSEVIFEDGYAKGVKARIGKSELTLPARMVVDASGRHTLLGRQLKLKVNDPIFDQFAVHAWYTDVDRGSAETGDFIHIYFLPVERGWCWQIPITHEITSMGIVAEKKVFREAALDAEAYFAKFVASNPGLSHAMRNAVRINDFKKEGDYSYSMKKFVGNGHVMVGDAARFVDPIFSSGVSIALYSAKYASERIRCAFETGDFSEAMFAPYEQKVRGGVNIWYEFIRLYYKLLPLFTHFIQSKEHRLEVLRLLQGEVYDRKDVPVLDAMRQYIRKVEASPDHVFRKQLSDIPID